MTVVERAGCLEKPLSDGLEERVCAGPDAPIVGEVDNASYVTWKNCANGTEETGCFDAGAKYTRDTGCPLSCLSSQTDSGPRGETCAAQTESAACKRTSVPCNDASSPAPPPIGVMRLVIPWDKGHPIHKSQIL
jgi:hypothetical protein